MDIEKLKDAVRNIESLNGDTLDIEAISELEESEKNTEILALLVQFLMGNIEETFKEFDTFAPIKKLDTLRIWSEVIDDKDELRRLIVQLGNQMA